MIHFGELFSNDYVSFLHIEITIVFLVNFLLRQKLSEFTVEVLFDKFHLSWLDCQISVGSLGCFFFELCLLGIIKIFNLFLRFSLLDHHLIAFSGLVSKITTNILHKFVFPGSRLIESLLQTHVICHLANASRKLALDILTELHRQFHEKDLHFEESESEIAIEKTNGGQMNVITHI